MKTRILGSLAVGLLAAQCWAGAVAAGVIYDQSPGAGSSSEWISSTLDNFGSTPGYRSTDDFTLAGGGIVTDVHWWGSSNSGGDSFTFTFYADDSGSPGTVLLATSGSLTSSSVSVGSFYDPVTFYSSDLAVAFIASPGSRYWLSIFNAAADASWLWLAADVVGNGSVYAENGSNNWLYRGTDLAFQLTGAQVPEPGTLVLLGLGLAGLGLSRRRKTS